MSYFIPYEHTIFLTESSLKNNMLAKKTSCNLLLLYVDMKKKELIGHLEANKLTIQPF